MQLYYDLAYVATDPAQLLKDTVKPAHFGEQIYLSDENVIGNYEDDFTCPVCWHIVRTPWVTALCCRKIACKACLDRF